MVSVVIVTIRLAQAIAGYFQIGVRDWRIGSAIAGCTDNLQPIGVKGQGHLHDKICIFFYEKKIQLEISAIELSNQKTDR